MHERQGYPHVQLLEMKALPKIGYMSFLGNEPIAAGFLRRLEGGYGQIDTLASNPLFGGQIRHEGVKLVVDALIMEAKALKLHGIIAYTNDPGVLNRAQSLGFVELNQRVIALKL